MAKILPKTNNKLIMERTPDKLFDGSYWTTWKSYQPGNPQYSVTVEFQENIVFRELRLVPDPIPFGTWWYNKGSTMKIVKDNLRLINIIF